MNNSHQLAGEKSRLFARVSRALAVLSLAASLALGAGALTAELVAPDAVSAQTAAQEQPGVVADVAAEANPAVVTITTMQTFTSDSGTTRVAPGSRQVPGEGDLVPLGTGSGFIIDEAGHVVTNNHVVSGGSAFDVTFYDGTTATATLLGADPFQDVAVLQLEQGTVVPGIVQWGDSDALTSGDLIVAIGTPYGEYANTVTSGIVNGMDRGLDSGRGYSLPNLVQHDADIYPGNSGGPLLNADGEVVGINVAKAYANEMGMQTSEGFNFAIESNAARQVVDEIIADGQYERSYLGIIGQPTWDGVQIQSLEAGGPAETSGLIAGDIITGVEGVSGNDPNEALNVVLFGRRPGDVVTLEILRNGQSMTIDVTLGERPVDTMS